MLFHWGHDLAAAVALFVFAAWWHHPQTPYGKRFVQERVGSVEAYHERMRRLRGLPFLSEFVTLFTWVLLGDAAFSWLRISGWSAVTASVIAFAVLFAQRFAHVLNISIWFDSGKRDLFIGNVVYAFVSCVILTGTLLIGQT